MRIRRAAAATALALVPALVLAGCFGGSDSTAGVPPSSGGPIPTATPYAVQPAATIVISAAAPPPPAATATATPKAAGTATAAVTYTVQAGDVLGRIAATYGVTVDAIMRANNMTDASSLRAGQVLTIPGAGATPTATPKANATATATATASPTAAAGAGTVHVVASGDTGESIANRYGVTVAALAAANGMTQDDFTRLQVGQRLTIPQ